MESAANEYPQKMIDFPLKAEVIKQMLEDLHSYTEKTNSMFASLCDYLVAYSEDSQEANNLYEKYLNAVDMQNKAEAKYLENVKQLNQLKEEAIVI